MEQTEATADIGRLAAGIVTGNLLGEGVLEEPAVPDAPDGYELIRALGRGGAGEVFLARDINLDRTVAVKFLRHASPADIERFRREARFAARLESDAIVRVFALGEHHGQPYIVMQYLDGGSLRQAELSLEQVLCVARTIAEALDHAHGEGIVHRDIKPENILLDGEHRPYLSDFGIARDVATNENYTLSREGQIIGTPSLMSPEQARGDVHAIDARTDVYALGATMYCKLTRRNPFEATNLVDLLHKVIHDEPALPRSFAPAIPVAVEALVMRCLAKRPDDRYQSMREVIGAIDAVHEQRDVGASASQPWFRRLIATRPEARVATKPAEPHAQPLDAEALRIIREIAEWDANLYRVTGSLTRAFERLDEMRRLLDERLRDRPDLAWARFYRGAVLLRRGELDEALDDLERSVDRVPDRAGAYFELGRLYLARYLRDHDVAQQHLSIVGVEYSLQSLQSGLEQAVVALQQAQQARELSRPWHDDYAEAVVQFADGAYRACIDICDRVLRREPELEDVWKLRGDAQQLAGDEPFESYQRAVEIRRSFFEALYAMARAYLKRDRIAEAQGALQRAIEIHPEFTEAMALYARTLLQQAGSSVETLRDARDLARRAVDSDPSSYDAAVVCAEIEMHLGSAVGDESHLDAAMEALDRAWDLKGCSNRVQLLRSWARLRRARLAAARGGDPEPMLSEVERFLDHESVNVPDNEPWLAVFEEIKRIRAEAG